MKKAIHSPTKHLINPEPQKGSIIVSILVVALFLTTVIFSYLVLANSSLARARNRVLLLQAQYAAESGADVAVSQLNNVSEAYTGTGGEVVLLNNNLYKSTFSVSVANGLDDKEKIVTAVGKVYAPASLTQANFTRTIEVVAQRSSLTASSSIVSRNIVELQSGVKNVSALDIYLNGYIHMNKNTTNLIAENITVADKNTGAGNCSIGGTGNLVKPTSFSDPAQTKTSIIVAYNNCIDPPGNNSNADFDVLANQINISKIRSTYIPWSQYMNNAYQSSPSGCDDWTTGSFPRNIPSTGSPKKTHYPDEGSGISALCGSSGDLALGTGQYIIRDHAHVRANLCAASGCDPTFYNPDSGANALKFVFVEGTINFSSVQTSPGSGPIVFVAYGADPSALNSVCPYGGAIYVGNNATTSAPGIFFLAINGLCLDKTKFSSATALGGVSGKNIYIATNPGTPFDLGLDPSFPVDQIPIDLAWRAVRYRRL